MINDIFVIMWKEARETFALRSTLRGGWIGLLVFIIVFGVFMPLQSGPQWIESPGTILVWAWVPFILVNSIVADSFAGERERRTLETMLASRLSDRAILFGKIAAAIAYGWGLTLVSVLLALLTINIAFGQGKMLVFTPLFGFAVLALSFLVSSMAAGLGVLVSLRATTVRQAYQTLSFAFLFFFIPLFLFPFLPAEWQQIAMHFFSQLDLASLLWIAGANLLTINVALLLLCIKRFDRRRLILDQS